MSARRIRNDIKSKRLTTDQLEQESKAMEKRLMELKAAMQKEREEREFKDGTYWTAGQKKSLFFYKPEFKDTVTLSKTTKIKILKDEEIVVNKRSNAPGTLAHLASQDPKKFQVLSTKSGNQLKETARRSENPPCGQCEEKNAVVHCQECCEDFCARCFAAFHLKGALKKHRSMPVSGFTPRVLSRGPAEDIATASLRQFLMPDNQDENMNKSNDSYLIESENHSIGTGTSVNFSKAVNATQQTVRQPKSTATHSTETTENAVSSLNSTSKRPVEIVFHSSLSYAEQLLLKKHRRQDLPSLGNSEGDSTDRSSVSNKSQYNETISMERIRTIIRDSENNNAMDQNENSSIVTSRPVAIEPLFGEFQEVITSRDKENPRDVIDNESPTLVLSKTALMNEDDNLQPKTAKSARKSQVSAVGRVKSARKSGKTSSVQTPREKPQGGHLAQLPSEGLKRIITEQDKVNKFQEIALPPGDSDEAWLMIGVAADKLLKKENSLIYNTPASTPRQASSKDKRRVSYKLYSMTPRSWKPHETIPINDKTTNDKAHLAQTHFNDTIGATVFQIHNDSVVETMPEREYLEELSKINQMSQSNDVSRIGSGKNQVVSLKMDFARGNSSDLSGGEYEDELESARKLEYDIQQSALSSGLFDINGIRDSLELEDNSSPYERSIDREVDGSNNDDEEEDDLDVLLSSRFQDSLDVERLPK